MKIINILITIFIAIILEIGTNSCSKNNDNNVPTNKIEQVIPAELLTQIKEYMPINEGTTPPNISGCYLMSPTILVYSTLKEDNKDIDDKNEWCDMYYKFTAPNSNNTIGYESKEYNDGVIRSSSYSTEFNIMGYGNSFTTYMVINSNELDGITAKKATIISGTKTSEGIENMTVAFIMLDKNDPEENLVPINTIRIFTDKDGLSINTTFPPQSKTVKKQSTNKRRFRTLSIR